MEYPLGRTPENAVKKDIYNVNVCNGKYEKKCYYSQIICNFATEIDIY